MMMSINVISSIHDPNMLYECGFRNPVQPKEESVPEREKFWFCEVDFPSLDSRAETAAGCSSPGGTS